MKILFVTNYKPNCGAISGQVEFLNKHLNEEGHHTTIFSTKGNIIHRLITLIRLINISKDYDIIHAHGCSGTGMVPIIFSVIAARHNQKRIITTYHGGGAESFFSKHTRLVRYFLTHTNANVVLSGFLGNVFDKYNIPYTIIPNIVELDESLYHQRSTIQPHFISIRTLSPLYNIECIIKAFRIVKDTLPEATLTIVGDGPSRPSLEELVNGLNLSDVTFTGRVPNTDIYNYLNKADIMVSSPHIDNMPVSVLEAFNAGLLVISSNVGGVPYMIENNINGLLFENDNHQQLANQMLYAINHQEYSKKMIQTAKINVQNYSWNSVKQKLFNLYNIQ